MIPKRIVPMFLLKGQRLVKGTGFKNLVDVGDPISQAMIYDAQGAEEIFIVDIEASREGRMIDTDVVTEMIKKCHLPIAAGGGVKNLDDARRCFGAGADKIVINTHAVLNPSLVREMADEFGSQSVVVSIDVKKGMDDDYDVYVKSGTQKVETKPETLIENFLKLGAGEIVVTSIDREGTLTGFDYGLYKKLRGIVDVPLIASGGSGCYDDMVNLFKETDCDACAIGKILFLRDYDIVRIKAYLKGKGVLVREA